MYAKRFDAVTAKMQEKGIDQLVIAAPSSVFYLTGKKVGPGERLLALYLDSQGTRKFFVNELFCITEAPGVDLVTYNDTDDPISIMAEMVNPVGTTGIEKTWPAHFLINMMERVPGLKIVNGSPVIDEVRMIKDPQEIELMQKSSQINDTVMARVVAKLREGHAEKDLARMLGPMYEEQGASGTSFFAIIAYGANAADPHHGSGASLPQEGESIIMDIGCFYNAYCSDMTRTVFYGNPPEEHKQIYEIVRRANCAAESMIKPGVRFCDIDNAARSVIEAAGFGPNFTHRTGHNIGIDVHEYPDVSSVNEMPIQEGMIFSIEPGIYLPGIVGVRIEDLVLVTADGCEVLNKYSKDMQIL